MLALMWRASSKQHEEQQLFGFRVPLSNIGIMEKKMKLQHLLII